MLLLKNCETERRSRDKGIKIKEEVSEIVIEARKCLPWLGRKVTVEMPGEGLVGSFLTRNVLHPVCSYVHMGVWVSSAASLL